MTILSSKVFVMKWNVARLYILEIKKYHPKKIELETAITTFGFYPTLRFSNDFGRNGRTRTYVYLVRAYGLLVADVRIELTFLPNPPRPWLSPTELHSDTIFALLLSRSFQRA